jgi:hypothetical protein
MFDVAQTQWWDHQVKQLKMLCVFSISDALKILNDHPEIVTSIIRLLE